MVVQGGARVLLQSESLGSLSPGKKADFILVDLKRLRHPSLSPDVDFLNLLLHRGLGRDVHSVFVGGQALMRDRTILTIDEESVATGIRRAMERQYPRMEALRPLYRRVQAEIGNLYKQWDLRLPSEARYQYNAH
jgi:5-methylthioadenosine/S-adenosylhomocysteine deaminase